MNAIQLARASGYAVLATASPRNAARLKGLGAEAVLDCRDGAAVDRIVEQLGGRELVGIVAIGRGSLTRAVRITRRTTGSRRIASACPTPPTRLRATATHGLGALRRRRAGRHRRPRASWRVCSPISPRSGGAGSAPRSSVGSGGG